LIVVFRPSTVPIVAGEPQASLTRCSVILQKICDEISGLCTRPVSFPQNLADEKPLPVDQESYRVTPKFVLCGHLTLRIEKYWEAKFELLLKISD